jgi:predicted P-loop ATPase
MNQDIEVAMPNGRVIPELDDHTDELIKAMFRETNYPLPPWTQYQHSISERHRFHPIKEYLTGLPAWDGVDHIAKLLAYIECDRERLFATLITKKLVASVARVYDVDAFFPVFVMLGGQRLGKSWLVRWLSPLPEYHYEGPVHPDDNDCLVRVGTTFFWEIGELGSTTKRADVESLKLFLTLPFIRVRKSYGRRDVRFPVCTSYWATVNESGFLKDRTGNSRFIVFNVGDIDWNYKDNVDHEQLWAQVYALYNSGYDWRLSEDELAYQKESNAEHRLKDPTDEAIFVLFEFTGNPDDVIPTARVSERVKDLPDTSTYGLRLRLESFGAGYKKSYRVSEDLNTSVYTGIRFRDKQEQNAFERLAGLAE